MTGRGWGAAWRAAGAFLLLVPLLPLRRLFGELRGAGSMVPPGEWLLGAFVFAAVAWLWMVVPVGVRLLDALEARLGDVLGHRAFVPLALLLMAGIVAFVSTRVFLGRPLLVDSVVQLFQARIFAGGTVWAPAPPEPGFFTVQHLLEDGGRWYAQYPPGHAGLVAAGAAVGSAWAVPLLLTLGAAWFLYLFARTAYGEGTGRLTLLLTLLCPFVWFMGASFMNHVSALFFVAAGLWCVARWEWSEGAGTAWLAGAGAALGAALLSRPLTAVAVGAVLGVAVLRVALRRGRWREVAVGAASGGLVSSVYLAFNAATTGHPLLPGYLKLWGESHGLGFHATPWGEMHGPLEGVRNQLLDLSLLNLHLFEWPLPALWPAAVLFLAGWAARTWDRRLLLILLAVPAVHVFYWHRDAYLGPRFLYVTVAALLPLTARFLVEARRRLDGVTWGVGDGPLRVPARRWVGALVVLAFGYGLAYGAPGRYAVYASGLESMKRDLAAEAREAGLEEALVFVAVSWGNRLAAGLRAAGASASLTERAYRSADHCRLQLLLDRARAEGWGADRVAAALKREVARRDRLVATAELNGDPTLRLRPDAPLAERCAEEIRYDAGGYTVYTPHLLANRPRLDGPLAVARDLRERNAALRARYPDRPAYLYRNGAFLPLPAP